MTITEQQSVTLLLKSALILRKQLIRKQNELLQYLNISNQQLVESSSKPESVRDDEEVVDCIEELYEDTENDDIEIETDVEMEAIAGESTEDYENDEGEEAAQTGVPRSRDIEYREQQPKLVLTPNFLKAREVIKQNTHQESTAPLECLPATLIINHSEKSVFVCSRCNIEFSSEEEAKLHINDHKFNAAGQACNFCNMIFKTRHNYEKHLESVHNNTKFVCQVCGKVFDSKIQHRSHQRNHDQTLRLVVKCLMLNQNSYLKLIFRYPCPFDKCTKAFRVKHHLNNHLRVHTKDSPFECSFEGCSARFRQKHALTIHERKHTGDYIACDMCKSPFVTQFQLNKHLKTCNGTFKPLVTRTSRSETTRKSLQDFSCPNDDCSKNFKTKADLELHVAKSHSSGDDSSLCAACCQVFESRHALKLHQCTNSMATCSICNYCFKDDESLSNHMLEYHETDEL